MTVVRLVLCCVWLSARARKIFFTPLHLQGAGLSQHFSSKKIKALKSNWTTPLEMNHKEQGFPGKDLWQHFLACVITNWLGTHLLPFWDENKSFTHILSPLSPPLSSSILTHPQRQKQTETHRGTFTSELPPAQTQIKTQMLPQERQTGEGRDPGWKRPERSGRIWGLTRA